MPHDPSTLVRRIQRALFDAGVTARALPGRTVFRAHSVDTIRLLVEPHEIARAARQTAAIQAACDDSAARVSQDGAWLVVEVPRPDPVTLPLATLDPGQIGVTTRGEPVVLNPRAAEHVLVAGRTGSGKSALVEVLVAGAIQAGIPYVLVDPHDRMGHLARKGRPWRAYASKLDDGNAVLRDVVAEMRTRYASHRSEPLAVICDESQLLDDGPLRAIACEGRKAGIRLVMGVQYVRADQLDPIIVDQCHTRISGPLNSTHASVRVLGSPDAVTLAVPGDMLGVFGGGSPVRFRAALGGPDDWARLPDAVDEAPPPGDGRIPPVPEPATDPPPTEVAAWVSRYMLAHGKPPAIGLVARAAREMLGSCGAERAQRWRDEIVARMSPVRPFVRDEDGGRDVLEFRRPA